MDYLSAADFFENINIRKQLTNRNIVYSRNASDQINDLVIDFSQCTTYTIDLRNATYIGSNPNIRVTLTGGSANLSKCRLKIIQAAAVTAPLNISFISSDTIKYANVLETLCNQNNARVSIEFDYVFVQDSTSEYIPIGITNASTPYTEDTNYTSNVIVSTGDAYVEAISKLDAVIAKLIPPQPPYINDVSVVLSLQQSTTPLYRLSNGASVNVVTASEPTFVITSNVLNSGGLIQSYIDTIVDGNIDLSTVTLSNNSLSIVKSKDSTNFYDVFSQVSINTANKSGGAIANSEVQHGVYVRHTDSLAARNSNTVNFWKCNANTFPIISNPTEAVLTTTLSNKISGLSVLSVNDQITVSARYNNVTFNVGDNTGFYPSTIGTLRLLSGSEEPVTVDGSAFSDMIANTPNTAIIDKVLTVSSNIFSESGVSVTAKSVSPRGTSIGIQVTDDSLGRKLLVDSVTNTNSGSVNYEFDHTKSLLTTDTLMIFNGRVQYPYNNWTSFVDGLNYSTITGWRKLVSKSIQVGGFSRIRITLPSAAGFEGALENVSNYRMEITRSDKPGEIYNGNGAYDGVGIVANSEGCLLLADSSSNEKVITFGEVMAPGTTATVTIYLNDNTKSFGQTLTYIAY